MSSGIEPVDLVDPWIYETLMGDTALRAIVGDRITNGAALGAIATPFVTWDLNSSRDITTHNGVILWNESLFEVKAIGQGGSFAVPASAARRIHAMLHGVKNQPFRGGTITCHRDRVIRYPELDDSVQFRHVGAIFRIEAHAGT